MMSQSLPKGKVIGFKSLGEEWSLYRLDDGNYLRIKMVMTKCTKTEQMNPDGTPVYFFQTQNVCTVLTADEVQKLYREHEELKP